MFRPLRLFAVTVLLTIPLAHASESGAERSRAAERRSQEAVAMPEAPIAPADSPSLLDSALAEHFAALEARVAIETEDGFSLEGGATEVIVARIGHDGKPILGCVDTEAGARRFFAAPVERLATDRTER